MDDTEELELIHASAILSCSQSSAKLNIGCRDNSDWQAANVEACEWIKGGRKEVAVCITHIYRSKPFNRLFEDRFSNEADNGKTNEADKAKSKGKSSEAIILSVTSPSPSPSSTSPSDSSGDSTII